MFADAGFNIADFVGRCWDAITAIASANLLIEVLWSFDVRLWVFSNIGNVVSHDMCLIIFCGCVVAPERAHRGIQEFLVGHFVLSPCDERVFAGQ